MDQDLEYDLDARKQTILKVIISNYLETGEPVGSRTISKLSHLQDVYLLIKATDSM